MKILTVEDDNMIREGISEYLSEFGYTVIQAKDGREALSKFNSDINLVILDIQIPFINGLEVLNPADSSTFTTNSIFPFDGVYLKALDKILYTTLSTFPLSMNIRYD